MSPIKELVLKYDALNTENSFTDGDTITGTLSFTVTEKTEVKSICARVSGRAHVRGNGFTSTSVRDYFDMRETLVGKESSDTVLPCGNHVYEFNCLIPQGSFPASFKGTGRKIVYKLEAKLVESKGVQHIRAKELSFVSKAIPNPQSLMLQQVDLTSKQIGFFSKGDVHMEATIDRGAYSPGETVMIVAKINNSSLNKVTPRFCLKQNVAYRSKYQYRYDRNVMVKQHDSPVQAQTQTLVKCAMTLPLEMAQTIRNCGIISVEYCVKVYLDISFDKNPKIDFPVVIYPPSLACVPLPVVTAHTPPVGAVGDPSNSDFPLHAALLSPLPSAPSSTPPYNISSTAPSYNLQLSAQVMNTDFLSQSDEAPPACPVLFTSFVSEEFSA